MRRSQAVLTVQAAFMYAIHIPFYVVLLLARCENVSTEFFGRLVTLGLMLNLCMIPVGAAVVVVSLSQLAGKCASPMKRTLTVKVALIPWYALNLLVAVLLIAGFLNPFLMVAVPVILAIEVGVTWAYMALTSLPSVVYALKTIICKKRKPSGKFILGIAFSFLLCLDVLGAILLKKELEKEDV